MDIILRQTVLDKDKVSVVTYAPSKADFSALEGRMFSGINFNSNKWDFSAENTIGHDKRVFIYDFNKIDIKYRNYVKAVIFYKYKLREVAFSTIKKYYSDLKEFCKFLSKKRISILSVITDDLVKEYLDTKKVKERTLQGIKNSIKNFLMEIEVRNENISFRNIYDTLLNVHDYDAIEAEIEEGKYPEVPNNTRKKILSLAIKDIKDKSLAIVDRMSACMLVILCETGMRIGEFARLQVNNLRRIEVKEDDELFYYLEFITYKTTGTKEWLWTKTFMTDKAILAYQTLEEILRDRRRYCTWLYSTEDGNKYSGNAGFHRHLYRFFYRHQDELDFKNMDEEELEHYSIWTIYQRDIDTIKFLTQDDSHKKIFYTHPHQYRVSLCTILAQKKPLDWVRKHMNHMDEAMTQHYIRRDAFEEEQINRIEEETLLRRANVSGSSLETSNETENELVKKELSKEEMVEAYKEINTFLDKKKLNIFKDTRQILDLLGKSKATITEMEEGYCARTAFEKLCVRQQYISSANDLYYIGPQIADIAELGFTYKRFLEKKDIIAHNQKLLKSNSKFKTEFDREKKGLEIFIGKKVIPEIQLLNKAIEEYGMDAVILKHKDLSDIIKNLSKIHSEVLKWKENN